MLKKNKINLKVKKIISSKLGNIRLETVYKKAQIIDSD